MFRRTICVVVVATLIATSIASAELVANWRLDDGSGTVAVDSSGNGHDGTLLLDPQWVDGKYDGALEFGGISGQRVEIEGYDGVLGTQNRSVMAWVKTAGMGDWISYGQNVTSQKWIGRINDNAGNGAVGALRTECSGGYIIGTTVLTDGEWHHLASVLDSAGSPTIEDIRMYTDGVLETISGFKAVDVNTVGGRNVWIADGHHDRPLASVIDDVRIYDHAMTELELLAAMADVGQIDMEIGYSMVPPVIDGQVDGIWEGASTQSFVPLEDPADGSGTWKVLYDAENLYVMVDITDDSLQNDSASSWQDDSVEIYFDGGNTKLDTPLSGDDHQYTFGWTADDIQGTNITGYTDDIEQAQVTTATGWRIEVKMPWMSIWGLMPVAGDLIGIDCYYNDDDDGGDSREGKMLSFSAVEGWNDASQWATAILAAIPKPVDPGTYGLAAYYGFENDVNDSSGNGNDGIIVGNPTWVSGVQGTALEFHGLGAAGGGGDYIDCGSGASLDITGPISLALWIRPDADDPEGQGTETAPMAKALSGMSPSWSYQVRYGWGSPQPYMAFTFNTSPRAWVYVGQNLTQGEWSHIACSHDGETLKCYLDGLVTDSTAMGQITSSPAPVLIGSDGWGCDWIGGIDEVAIYNRALSTGEILYLAGFRAPVDPGTDGLVAYYTLDNDANDFSGNNNHGTLSGDPQWATGIIGGALEFDGVDDHVDCGNDPSLDITGDTTIGAWVYPTGSGSSNYPRVVDKSDGTGGADPGYKMYLRGAENYLVTLSAGGTYLNSSTAAVPDSWNYVAFVISGEQWKLYLNGIWEQWDGNPSPSSSSNPLFIGDSPAGARPFNGLIDEIVIYNRALSEPEVRFIAGER